MLIEHFHMLSLYYYPVQVSDGNGKYFPITVRIAINFEVISPYHKKISINELTIFNMIRINIPGF